MMQNGERLQCTELNSYHIHISATYWVTQVLYCMQFCSDGIQKTH